MKHVPKTVIQLRRTSIINRGSRKIDLGPNSDIQECYKAKINSNQQEYNLSFNLIHILLVKLVQAVSNLTNKNTDSKVLCDNFYYFSKW